jgi:hypothetical protein
VKNPQNRIGVIIEFTISNFGGQKFWQCVQIITLCIFWHSCRTFVRKMRQVKTVIFDRNLWSLQHRPFECVNFSLYSR